MSEEYQVIARKYRPMRFSDVVGQEVVTRTLMNAIKQNRTAHAYLLVGPRGVGKTTLARIFAKALNCENPQDGEPCCACQSCLSIAEESNLDVIEIDAASRNSVEDMRNLTEESMHMPISSKYKIYIIDEIHMLSNQAWNALLKTVEEPPKHVKFIFATTEVHKVLATIISRCQRFDLMPITTSLIAERLKFIADDQGVLIDDDAVFGLARAAEGGMRDAQSLLDQIISFFAVGDKSHRITGEEVMSLFGLADRRELYDILESILKNDTSHMVSLIHNFVQKGKNLETLFEDILIAIRGVQLTLLLHEDAINILEESPDVIAKYKELSNLSNLENIQILMENLTPSSRMLRDSLNKQIFLETILLKAMREANSLKISDLIKRLSQLKGAGELEFVNQVPVTSSYVAPVESEKKNEQNLISQVVAEQVEVVDDKIVSSDVVVEKNELNHSVEKDIERAKKAAIVENIETNPNYHEVAEVDVLQDMGKISPIQEKIAEDVATVSDPTMVEPISIEEITRLEELAIQSLQSNEEIPVELIADSQAQNDNPTHQLRDSIFNDTAEVERLSKNPDVQKIIELLGGKISDVHVEPAQVRLAPRTREGTTNVSE